MNASGWMATQRFGLGAWPGEAAAFSADPRGALLEQLDAPLGPISGLPDSAEADRIRQELLDRRRAAAGDPGELKAVSREIIRLRREYGLDWLVHVATAPRGFPERLAAFWSNHFAVSGKPRMLWTLRAAFENDVVRAHTLGRFADIAHAALTHPAMLIYLDNVSSVGPNSTFGRNRGQGLNENLAREYLELHTLGADGGYDQTDVTELAKVLSGWRTANPLRHPAAAGRAVFAAPRHEPGAHRVMGRTYDGPPKARLERAARDLASHEATARNVAREMARAFVSDRPSHDLVEALRLNFLETDGDLRELARTLVTHDDAWVEQGRIVPPRDWMVSVLRGFLPPGELGGKPAQLLVDAQRLGQPLWSPESPDGFEAAGGEWLGPEGLRLRLDLANRLLRSADAEGGAANHARLLVGDALSEATRVTVERSDGSHQGLVLLAMSPELQRR